MTDIINNINSSRKQCAVAVVFMQPQCNMYCNFCVTENNFNAMTFEQGVRLLRFLKVRGFKVVVLGGGEPFAWPNDLVELTKVAKGYGFKTVQVGTNGINMPAGFAEIKSIDRYVLPLESVNPNVHNLMRVYKDNQHHRIIMDRLNTLKQARKSVTISTVVTKINLADVVKVGRFLRDEYNAGSEHVHAWHLYQFLPYGRGGEINRDALLVGEDEYLQIFEQVQNLDMSFRVYKRADMYKSQTVDFFWYDDDDNIKMGSSEWGTGITVSVIDE